MTLKMTFLLLAAMTGSVGAGAIGWKFGFFVAPFAWTREPARLADVLGMRPGIRIADIGAGSGALAMALAELAGSAGQVYATELSPDRRADIERRVGRMSADNVRVVAASAVETGLPDDCCDAAYMRAVFHHVDDKDAFAVNVARGLRPGGRVALIDFAPGTLWFHGADHGVRPETVVNAFRSAGLRLRQHIDDWGGGMFLLVFER
jgi:ubiquinone/menaquinone biosynthesis C-methylase UbiE